jgi:hypothetical protein
MGHVQRHGLTRALAVVAALALAAAPAGAASPRRFDAGPATYVFDQGPGRTLIATAELQGVLLVPRGAGRHPVVVIEHGRHDWCVADRPQGRVPWRCPPGQHEFGSFAGYGYLLRSLASRGFAVLSVDANAATIVEDGPADATFRRAARTLALDDVSLRDGMAFRAGVIDTLLERLATADRGGADPFGLPLAGRLDLGRVGLVGHSRGGEGVVTASLLGGRHRYRVRGVFVISPVDFERRTLDPHVAFGSLVSYCDGDVSDLEGLEYLDDARRTPRTAPLWQVVLAANHDFFNRRWPDEVSDADLGGMPGQGQPQALVPAPYCALQPSGRRLRRAAVEHVASVVVGAFMAHAVAGRAVAARLLGASTLPPATIAGAAVVTTFVPPAAARLDLVAARTARDLHRNLVGGITRARGFARATICRPLRGCLVDAQLVQPASTLDLRWTAPGARLVTTLPRGVRDLRRFRTIAFRAAVAPGRPNPAGAYQRLSVVLRDAAGRTAAVAVRAREPALRYPPVGVAGVANLVLGSVRVRLASFHGIDRRRVASIALVFGRTAAGRVLVTDLSALR